METRFLKLKNFFCRFLHSRLRTATLRNDFEGQAVLINCLLRNYLHYNLYDQADKLVSKSVYPESASNNEWARFLYYLGECVFLHYGHVVDKKCSVSPGYHTSAPWLLMS